MRIGVSLRLEKVSRVLLLWVGQAHRLGALPDPLAHGRRSHFRLFGQLQGVINLDTAVAYGALELGVSKQ